MKTLSIYFIVWHDAEVKNDKISKHIYEFLKVITNYEKVFADYSNSMIDYECCIDGETVTEYQLAQVKAKAIAMVAVSTNMY